MKNNGVDLVVFSDGSTFEGISGCSIYRFKCLTEEQEQDLENGYVPNDENAHNLFVVSIDDLLEQAIKADLPCVQNLKNKKKHLIS